MRRQLHKNPRAVVAEFRAACGCTSVAPDTADIAALDAGLAALEAWDERTASPTLAVCGEADTLISPDMSNACFP
jgi:hypothetical protein